MKYLGQIIYRNRHYYVLKTIYSIITFHIRGLLLGNYKTAIGTKKSSAKSQD